MKAAIKLSVCLVMVLGFLSIAQAEDAKEKTLKGTITCAKCDLGESPACHTVIKVKDTIYWFTKDSKDYGKHHKAICKAAKKGSVTGVVSEKDGKHWIKVSKVDLD